MARKLQIKRGAKADLPVLSQGEFGMCTDSGAEELHIGNGSKNIQIPLVGYYTGDMNELVVSGIYRVGANTNLPASIAYGQVLVMQGASSDTVCQIGMGYTTSKIFSRSGVLSSGTWTFTDWVTPYSSENPPDADSLGLVAKAGDVMTGKLSIQNTSDYLGMTKTREIDDVPYIFGFGVGSDTTRGASGSLRLVDDAATVLGRIDAWADGSLTHQVGSSGYMPIARAMTGTYTGTGKYGSENKNSLTFPFTPKFVYIGYYAYTGGCYVWGYNGMPVGGATNLAQNVVSVSGNTMYWYNINGAPYQLNSTSTTYHYVAIG